MGVGVVVGAGMGVGVLNGLLLFFTGTTGRTQTGADVTVVGESTSRKSLFLDRDTNLSLNMDRNLP